MIKGKKGPYIHIFMLIITLFFILGMQYGKGVERSNEVITYLLSITPSKAPSPTVTQTITYETYTHDECGVSFLYPSFLSLSKEASSEATFESTDKNQRISISCINTSIPTPSGASSEAILDNRPGIAYEEVGQGTIEYRVRSPLNDLIIITVSKELAPLFESSFDFIQ